MTLKKFDDIKKEKEQKEKERKEFIEWLDKKTLFSRTTKKDDNFWTDDSDCYYNLLNVIEKILYQWEENHQGTSNHYSKEYSFEEFKQAYENNTLK